MSNLKEVKVGRAAIRPEILHRSAFGPTMLPGNPTRAQLVEMYEQRSGRSVNHPVFYYIYGLFKLAVIVQQIYRPHQRPTFRVADSRAHGLWAHGRPHHRAGQDLGAIRSSDDRINID